MMLSLLANDLYILLILNISITILSLKSLIVCAFSSYWRLHLHLPHIQNQQMPFSTKRVVSSKVNMSIAIISSTNNECAIPNLHTNPYTTHPPKYHVPFHSSFYQSTTPNSQNFCSLSLYILPILWIFKFNILGKLLAWTSMFL